MTIARSVLFFALLSAGSAGAASGHPPVKAADKAFLSDVDATLATQLPALLASSGVPSVSVAHIVDGRVVALQAAGEHSAGRPATAATTYNVASLTKPITAEVALRLMSEGAFSLDESMAEDWVDPDISKDPRSKLLTPRLALSHQTGLPNWRDAKKGLLFERDPGSVGYSGEGYEYLRKFIDKRTGTALDAQAKRLLFAPLGMTSTSYTRDPQLLDRAAWSRSEKGTWVAPFTRSTALASDDLQTTAEDYARFLTSLMDDEALSPELAAERRRIQGDRREETCNGLPPASCPDLAGFALGWEVFEIHGQRYFMHTGMDVDTFTIAYWNPDDRSGTVILTNSHDGYRIALPILDLIGANQEFVGLLRAMAAK